MVVQQASVQCETPQHQTVHEHPSHKRWRGAFVEARYALFADRLEDAVKWAAELGGCRGLQADFDCVEGVTDWDRVSPVRVEYAQWKCIVPLSLAMPEKTPATKPL